MSRALVCREPPEHKELRVHKVFRALDSKESRVQLGPKVHRERKAFKVLDSKGARALKVFRARKVRKVSRVPKAARVSRVIPASSVFRVPRARGVYRGRREPRETGATRVPKA